MPDTPAHAPPAGTPSVGELARSPLGTTAPEPGLVSKWQEFLSRPEVKTALFQFGVAMLAPQRGGGDVLSRLGPALGEAGQAVGRLRGAEREEEQVTFERGQTERRTEAEVTRAGAAERQAGAAEAAVGVSRERVDVARAQNEQLAKQAAGAAKLKQAQIRNQGFGAAAKFYGTAVDDAARVLKIRLENTLLLDPNEAEAETAAALSAYNAAVKQAEVLAETVAGEPLFEAPSEAAPGDGAPAPAGAAATDTELEAAFRSWTAARVSEFISKAPPGQQERLRGIAARVDRIGKDRLAEAAEGPATREPPPNVEFSSMATALQAIERSEGVPVDTLRKRALEVLPDDIGIVAPVEWRIINGLPIARDAAFQKYGTEAVRAAIEAAFGA